MQERVPTILVSDGWETNENDELAEVVIPSTVETYNVPSKIIFLGDTLSWIPSNGAKLQEFEAPNMTSFQLSSTFNFTDYTQLVRVSMPSLVTLTQGPGLGWNNKGGFGYCTYLSDINMPALTSISVDGQKGMGPFSYCIALANLYLPELVSINDGNSNNTGHGTFTHCTGLVTVTLPKLKSIITSYGPFRGDTALESVQLGSEGHPVTSLPALTFNSCTQSGLTITVYTQGGAALANEPWGATNATIVYETA